MMKTVGEIETTIVTAGDRAFAWGSLLLVASMRMNGMRHPVVVGAMDWTDEQKRRILSLGGVTIRELAKDRRCVTCQKPMLMTCEDVKTPWVCWADSDGAFVGDCSEWLKGENEDEIAIRKYSSVPPDFTQANLAVWKRDVERICGEANDKSRYETRVNAPFIVIHTKWRDFLNAWTRQMEKVLPGDVEIIMKKGSPYFQTDESVLGSLLCFLPSAPKIAENYRANGSADKTRYFAHFAYNPKPWQMWNSHSLRWHDVVSKTVAWLLEKKIVTESELPGALRPGLWWFWRAIAPVAPWVWRGIKLKRRVFAKLRG